MMLRACLCGADGTWFRRGADNLFRIPRKNPFRETDILLREVMIGETKLWTLWSCYDIFSSRVNR